MERARIMMDFGEDGIFPEGDYPFSTPEEKNKVNERALEVRDERGVRAYVDPYTRDI